MSGEDKYIGAGVHFCATCDGPFYKGQPVAVVGGGNSATEESLFLTKFVERVTLLVRGSELKASQILKEKLLSHPHIDIQFNTEVVEFNGKGSKLKSVTVKNNKTGIVEETQRQYSRDGVRNGVRDDCLERNRPEHTLTIGGTNIVVHSFAILTLLIMFMT